MTTYIADNQEIEKLIITLGDTICAGGGFLHNDLNICCRNGNLSLEAPDIVQTYAPLITVPNELLLPIADTELGLNGDDIDILSIKSTASSAQVTLLETMIALYNLTNKIADHRSSTPKALFFNDSDLLMRISDSTVLDICTLWEKGDFYLESFLSSRVLGIKIKAGDKKTTNVLMPIIDFFNHHPFANAYSVTNQQLGVHKFSTAELGNECFVSYGRFCDHHALIGYDYVETRSWFIISRPMTITLSNGSFIEIGKQYNQPHNLTKVPDFLQDLMGFLPSIQFNEKKNTLMLSCIRIPPPNAPRAMRRILEFAIANTDNQMKKSDLSCFVTEAEHHIINHNKTYYTNLIKDLEEHQAKPGMEALIENIRTMMRNQLLKINAYSVEMPLS